jgi:hypothetical protein
MQLWLVARLSVCAVAAVVAVQPSFAQRLTTATVSVGSYEARLEAYTRARNAFEAQAGPYWEDISEKRKARFAKRRHGHAIALNDYVLTQPPLYAGPPAPVDPDAPRDDRPRASIPVVADFLQASADHYRFVPDRPQGDLEFKRTYAALAKASGLNRDQIVRIYAFETGGNGSYDVQSGLTHPRPNARAISTAVGYNQLLTTNTVSMLAEHGDHFVGILRQWAGRLGAQERQAMERKIEAVRRMIAVSRTVPRNWNEQGKLAKTERGYGMHALLLDRHVGPLLQVQKLLNSIVYARSKGHNGNVTAAELEMMNLTGDGNGFDLVMMPEAYRERVATSNFFQRGGYERNGIARRSGTVAGLYGEMNSIMDRLLQQPGAKELAASF